MADTTKSPRGRKAPWPDFKGGDVYAGDTIRHRTGATGTVLEMALELQEDAWRVDYGEGHTARLCLQVSDDGMATVVRPRGRQPGYRAKNPKIARLAIQVTRATKRAVEKAAERSDISAGEYVRRAIAAYMAARK